MKKWETFKRELSMIKDEGLVEALKDVMANIPKEFFTNPASSTNKYHPRLSNERHGLYMHTRFAFWIAVALIKKQPLGQAFIFNDDERDIILAALLLHDTMKYGDDNGESNKGYTYFDHPIRATELFKKIHQDKYDKRTQCLLSEVEACISCHMGRYSTSRYHHTILPVPQSNMQWFVHLCDVTSGIEFCSFDFNEIDRFLKNQKPNER